jgi:magnesium-protoporphyrin IX monomethyl ester (oxidative) cyclase
MKVLLIQPPFTIFRTESKKCHPPLGLAYLAAVLKDDFEVKVLDALAEGYNNEEYVNSLHLRYGLSFVDIKKKIIDFSPDIICVSCLFSAQVENVHKICRLAKESNNKIITIVGGGHPSAVPEQMLQDLNIDFVVLGEGETTLRKLLENIELRKDICEIQGIAFRMNGRIKINFKKKFEENLDSLPFPYWDIFPLKKYFKINNPHGSPAKNTSFLPVITSRGCPFECIFCSIHNLWGRNYRTRSAENVLKELDYLVHRFGIKEILFEDDNLTLDKERAEEIFRGIIHRNLDILWSVPNGVAVQTLDDDVLESMKKSGCYSISLGIESGDEYVLKNIIRKPLTLFRVKSVLRKALALNLETSAFFVVGLPGENLTNLKNTFSFARGLNVDNVNFFFATPLPGTRLLQICNEEGLVKGWPDYSRLKLDTANFSTKELPVAVLNSLVKREKIKIQLLYFIKRPRRFAIKLYNKLKNDPGYFARYFLQFSAKNSDAKVGTSLKKTACGYSFLWSKYKDTAAPKVYHFDYMQKMIPVRIVRGGLGLDLGCGCGWDTVIMAKNNPTVKVLGIDISDGVYNCLTLTNDLPNVNIVKASVEEIPLKDGVCDFVYSFGVLHHTPNYKKSFLEIARVLKKRAPCFLYLYEDHSENIAKYIVLKLIRLMRNVTVRMPSKLLYILCVLFSPLIFVFFAIPAKILSKSKLTSNFVKGMPFNFAGTPFSLSGDLYDRFSVPIEYRFSRSELYDLFEKFGFFNIAITRLKNSAGWVAWGYKSDS